MSGVVDVIQYNQKGKSNQEANAVATLMTKQKTTLFFEFVMFQSYFDKYTEARNAMNTQHLNNDDPSGHLSLSIGLIEQLRNSIYTDLALRIKESSLQTLKCRANQAGRQILKEPPLVGSQQVKDHVFQSEPTGLISLASHANFEGDISHVSSKEVISDIGKPSPSAPWRRDAHQGAVHPVGGNSPREGKEETQKQMKTSLSFSDLNRACVVFQHIYEDSEQMS